MLGKFSSLIHWVSISLGSSLNFRGRSAAKLAACVPGISAASLVAVVSGYP